MALEAIGPQGGSGAGKALYRRYRPQEFEEVIGQEHVTGPLMQALRTGRFGHAYLFSGPRGCGKTTSARILARCLNCEQGPTPTPCGECASCVALATGGSGSIDVIEIDAASHGGVDDARDLREKASYGPAQSRYKVYIIDEAHMVTPQGFNALLKIVEEPPEHVKFIFATTEPEKVIGTIRSRTHHYPFRLVPPARLQDYLAQLCQSEGVPVEPGVLSFVIRAGGGSVRDSLSVLDQLMAGSTQEGLTYAGAASLLGFTEGELLDATIGALAARDGAGVFRQVDRTIETGQDPRRFVEDLLERLRDLIVVAAVGASGGDIAALFRGIPLDQIERMRQQAASFGPGELSHSADVVNTGLTQMTGATSPRLQLELICARLLLPASAGEHGIVARVDRIERRLDLAGTDPVGPQVHRESRSATPAPPAPPSPPRPASGAPREALSESATPATARGDTAAGQPQAQQAQARGRGAPAPASDAAHRSGGRADSPVTAGQVSRGAPAAGQRQEVAPEGGGPTQETTPSPEQARRAQGGLDTDAIRRSWPDVLAKVFSIRRVTWTFLSEHAQVLDYDGGRLLLGISTRGLATTFRGGQHGEVVRQALIDAIGLDTRVEAIPADEARARPAVAPAQAPAQRDTDPHARQADGMAGLRAGADASRAADQATGWRGGDDAPGWAQVEPPHDDDAWVPPPDAPQSRSVPSADDPRISGAPNGQSGPPGARGGDAAKSRPGRASQGRPGAASEPSAAALARGPNGAMAPAAGTRPLDSPGPAVGERAGDAGSSGLVAFRRARADQAKRAGAGGGGRPGTTGAPGASSDTAAKTRVNPSSDRTGLGPAGSTEDEVSADDEVIEDLSAVGQPVIASVLGGVVIGEDNG